jgi:hypothetical protein
MTAITDTAAERSIELLFESLLPEGFVASPADEHYASIWGRDAAMACLGASHSAEPRLIAGVEATLRTLATLATPLGQVPNVYWPRRGYWDWGEGGTTDATAWLVIALAEHVEATGRERIADELWPDVEAALRWLEYQDVTGTGLVDSPAGGDWMDGTLRRAGRVFHVNVLYHWAATGAVRLAQRLDRTAPLDPDQIGAHIEGLFWPLPGSDLADLSVARYPEGAVVRFPHPLAASEFTRVSRADRDHHLALVAFGQYVDRCDVLAESLAIASGLTTARAEVVLDFMAASGCAEPYPSRTWPEPFQPDEPGTLLDIAADALQDPRWRNPPGSYHNGAVWPYIGGAHARAAAIAGRDDEARTLLAGAAEANALDGWSFPEWIHRDSGQPGGARRQAWNAGAYLWAYSGG